MLTFLVGLAILLVGGLAYGKYCETVFGPDDRETPAVAKADGVDFVVMKKWKNSLIELLNIAGTGPILGPIQGILFGPIAFITIPVGCVLAGSLHDYFSGMISMRNGGAQMPKLIQKYLGKGVFNVYNIVVWILMLLVGAVFVYTPGDLIVNELIGQKPLFENPTTWIVYAAIFLYYLIATLFPIDQIIGRVYPIFGAILIFSAIGIFAGIMLDGGANLQNLNFSQLFGNHPSKLPFVPVFFITVACGIMSGFHSTQATLIGRAVKSEKEGRMTFFNMMLVEGFIAMCWAAGAMILFGRGTDIKTGATLMIGLVSREFLGPIGAIFAIAGVIVLPITSGDTAFRSLRLMLAETFHIDQVNYTKRVTLTAGIFVPAIAILYYAKSNTAGFNILWRYFAFTNQTIAVFALAMISVYLLIHGKNYLISLIPGMFYCFVVTSYIIHAPIGLGLETKLGMDPASYTASYIAAGVLTAGYALFIRTYGTKQKEKILNTVIE
ncbi:carbon starvation CstA family protein [Youngiibacter multivorans]|uniref:Carbon starvation protein CstA n=1 Tax=Youngiibacter multivorans TaxID=937251 RepID=A0ABS4G5V9_9CLOT|nr:carbon starvation protein A [Youngiibacter multivorans]MBP1919916.1 carbon starvation protein CstA [Youngiibacter multivorans]